MTAAEHVDVLHAAFHEIADDECAGPMAAYMKHRFAFFGVAAGPWRGAQRPFVRSLRDADVDEVLDTARLCWEQPVREFLYTASDLLRAHASRLGGEHLIDIEGLIRTKSWWDTVDLLAAHVVGPIVSSDRQLALVMDRWIDDDDIWIARTAILHQLTYRDRTDVDRLFRYVDRRSGDTEFFVRKASGWALREYAKTDPDEVLAHIDRHEDELSGLSKREALKHLR